MIGYIGVITEEGKRAWIRADEVGTFYETKVHPQPKPGRPAANATKPVPLDVVALCLRHSKVIHAKRETLETITNKLQQALGGQVHLVATAVFEEHDRPVIIPREDDDEEAA